MDETTGNSLCYMWSESNCGDTQDDIRRDFVRQKIPCNLPRKRKEEKMFLVRRHPSKGKKGEKQ